MDPAVAAAGAVRGHELPPGQVVDVALFRMGNVGPRIYPDVVTQPLPSLAAVRMVCLAGIVLLALGWSARAQDQAQPPAPPAGSERTRPWGDRYYYGGMPKAGATFTSVINVLTNEGYVVGYCEARRDPVWACYRLSEVASLQAPPRPKKFVVDVRTRAKVASTDYTNSGYDRGHMAPNYAVALCYGVHAQQETFLMSNIIPQSPNLNRRIWEHLEQAEIKTYAQRFKQLWAMDGPIFRGSPKKLGGGVAVPDACFKILAVEENKQPRILAFIMPQTVSGAELPQQFLTSVAEIEKETGLIFFSDLPKDLEQRVETQAAKRMW